MRKFLIGVICALVAANSWATTLSPIQLLNPAGSTAGQAILSAGSGSAPAWANVSAAALTGITPVLNGGTGVTTASAELSRIGAAPLASASPTGTWAFAARPTFNGQTPYDTGNLTIANYLTTATAASTYATIAQATTALAATGGSINGVTTGLTTPLAGKFTTLQATSLAKVLATKTTALSLPNGAATVITGWTTTFDANSNFVASTGVFTAPATGYYIVSAQVVTASGAIAAGTVVSLAIVVNGVGGPAGETTYPSASGTNTPMTMQTTALISLTAGQTIAVQAFQNSGAAVNTTTNTNSTYISIAQIP